ncbi:hypothetical protein B0H15DRAFT_953557 [Mycena belliarum]|uniref:Uncharacterized protein n=1 Tax=Mycena belliarum TaxID=1033014 RepID=A0AAD6TWS3_9AGAR|nr:hypothetical protein B0H15DRAFT_953557 [Mycena belliae]
MVFPDLEDVVEHIMDELFLDKTDEDGVYDHQRLPKNFLGLALVSRSFLNPVRRNIYNHLQIEGPERFLLLTGQLRFSPHLAKWVKSASLVSGCSERGHIDGDGMDTPGGNVPRTVSYTALKWFLDACPQLTRIDLSGGDFLWALAAQNPKNVKLTDVALAGCSMCDPNSPEKCTMELQRGWLKNIVSFPRLKELDISEFPMHGPRDSTLGIQSNSSACTGLSISNMSSRTSSRALITLLRSMPSLKELALDGLHPMPHGDLRQCLNTVASTLTLLTLSDYHSQEGDPQPWENDTVSGLHQLKTLSLNGVPVTAPFLSSLPARIEHLRFSGTSLSFLPAPELAKWLRRKPFPLHTLKKLEVVGQLRKNSVPRGPKAPDTLVAELGMKCQELGIEWIHRANLFERF